MKRPLAAAGLAALLTLLVAARLPAVVLCAVCGVLATGFALCLALWRRVRNKGEMPARSARYSDPAALVLGAALAALLLRLGYDAALVRPVAALDGAEHTARARVTAVEPGYGGDTVHATLKVLSLDGERAPALLKVRVYGLPSAAALGQELELPLRFYAFGSTGTRNSNYAKGFYIAASSAGEVRAVGESHTLLTRLRALQYAMGDNIRERLPLRLSGVAAAMAVGDRRTVPDDISAAYRAAGISHVMVVSGLHLSMLCGFFGGAALAVTRRRRLADIFCIGFVLFFMVLTGLSPSIVRSGVVWLLMYTASLVYRRADAYTSLGLAALLLLCQNPWAAVDAGLLLSFAATLGALASGGVFAALRRALVRRKKTRDEAPQPLKVKPRPVQILSKIGRYFAGLAVTSVCVTLATLPVLVYAGMGISLLSLPMNLAAVPLLAPIVLCGLAMAIPPALPVLGLLGLPASLVAGFLLNLLETLARACETVPGAYVPVGGLFGLVLVAAVYFLVFLGVKTRRVLACALCAALLLAGAGLLHTALDAGTVKITVAGSGANASLVVTRDGQSAILYRSRQSAYAVQRALRENTAGDCVLFIDLRQTAESTEYDDLFSPRQVVSVADVAGGGIYAPLDGVTVSLARQGDGAVACVDVDGYKVGLATGRVDLTPYAPLDVLVAGRSEASGEYAVLLAGASAPDWAAPIKETIHSDGDAQLWLRPGKSVKFSEVRSGADGG